MRKKEDWMKKGNFVLADGKRGSIHKFEENTALGTVYNFWVLLEGQKKPTGPYHPNDISPLP